MRNGEITINVIMVMFISIVSIGLLLGLFSTKLPSFAKSIYCKTFFFIHSSTFMPKSVRQDQSYCNSQQALETVILSNETTLNVTLIGYMTACWEKGEFGKYNENILCYELTVGPRVETPTEVTEKEITKILAKNKICDMFANNDFESDIEPLECGDSDDIMWDLFGDEVRENQNILVEYIDNQIKIS